MTENSVQILNGIISHKGEMFFINFPKIIMRKRVNHKIPVMKNEEAL